MATAPLAPWQTPGYFDMQGINRQREMAKILMQQGQSQPQGQMVSGRYVAPTFGQYLAPALATFAGNYKQNKADEAEKELAGKLQKQASESWGQYGKLMAGDQGVAPVQGPTPEGANLSDTVTPRAPVAPDRAGAINFALQSNNPELRALAIEKLKGMKLGEGEVFQELNLGTGQMETTAKGGQKYRAPIQADVGSHIEYRDPHDPTKVLARVPKGVDPAKAAELADQGIAIPGGGYGGGGNVGLNAPIPAQNVSRGAPSPQTLAPQGSPQTGGAPTGAQPAQGEFKPAFALPQYEYDPSLSPRDNRELAKKFQGELQTQIKNAKTSFDIVKDAAQLLNTGKPSSSGIGNLTTWASQQLGLPFGIRADESKADAQLVQLGAKLTASVPRFEGPQSNIDVAFYKEAAGNIGNASLPIETRLAALKTVIDLNKKYYPSAQWDQIDLGGAVKQVNRNVPLGFGDKTFSPDQFRQGLKPEDQQAFDWARKNPNDPRAKDINKRLGI